MGLDSEQINYEQIKQLARKSGQRVTDLVLFPHIMTGYFLHIVSKQAVRKRFVK